MLDAVYLLLISTAVFLFIYAGCSMDTYELLVDNETYRKKAWRTLFLAVLCHHWSCLHSLYVGLGMLFAKRHGEPAGYLSPLTYGHSRYQAKCTSMRKK